MSEVPLSHPTTDELRALSLGQLAQADLAYISAHLADCPECCRCLDQLTADDALLARLRQSAARRDEALVSLAQRRPAVRVLRQRSAAKSTERDHPDAAPVIHPPPRQVGDYDILAEVGRGGMGVVYQARHRRLHRLAALKMVLAGEFASPTQELRFRLEAELAARVRHPNIVQVYEVGSHDGRPFLALEWVGGGSLAALLDGRPWPPDEAAALVETLARAIHVAHGEGVVHRDLKPANILLSAESKVLSAESDSLSTQHSALSTPKITDFGLARPTEGGLTLTQSGTLVGTPGYMAPEQAGGKRALVGPATDIYALGVILYQLLTGQLPFRGDSTLEVLRAVASDEPTRPRRLQPRLPRDLEAVTLHCLEKEPSRRYPSALALAEDLERFRAGKPVVARPVGAAARLARAARRRPLVALLLALLAVSLVGGLAGVTWKWREANAERDQANAGKQAALYEAYRARIAAAGAALQNHDVADAARQLAAAPESLRGWEWHHFHSRLDDSSSAIPVPADADGVLLAAPDRLRVGAWTAAGLRLTDVEGGGQTVLPLGPQRGRRAMVTPTRQGLRVVTWDGTANLNLIDEAGRRLCRVELPDAKDPGLAVVSPDGTRLACHRADIPWFRVAVFDAASGRQTAVCDGHRDGLWVFTFSPDGTRIATGGEDRTARLRDAATGALLATCRGHASKVIGVAFSPDGARLVTTSSDGTVRQWDAATGREAEPAYDRHSGEVTSAAYSPDGQWVASTGTDRTVRVWRAAGRQDVAVLHGHTGGVANVAFAPDGRRLASLSVPSSVVATADCTARVWDVDPQATLPVLRGHKRSIYPVAFSPDGRWIASGSWDATVRVWDAATGMPCATLPHPDVVRTLAYDPGGRWLMTGGDGDARLWLWDVATARVVREIRGPGEYRRALAVSPDGARVAATAFDTPANRHRLHVYDVASGERLFSAPGVALAYSPDGRWLAVGAADEKAVLLLDARTHEPAGHLGGHEKAVMAAAFSPDGRLLATVGSDHAVRLWPLDGGVGRVLHGHTDEVFAVAFHPDGRRLATGGHDRAVWLWDLARGEEVARLPGHTSFVWSLAFSPDGATLASGSGDATVRLWDTTPLKARHRIRREVEGRRLEAERLVERLGQRLGDTGRVVDAIRTDRTLDDPLRQAALGAVLRRAWPPDAAAGDR